MAKIALVAGNFGQAKYWAEQWGLRKPDWFYVSMPEYLYGVHDIEIRECGRPWDHPYYSQIMERVSIIRADSLRKTPAAGGGGKGK